MKDAILGIVRHILTAGGGALVANGVVADGDVQTAIGAIVALVGVVLSVLEKRKAK